MARYIDADKADVRSIHSSYMGYSSCADVLEWLQSQPAADVVEVVRCKDCDIPHNKWTGCPKLNGLIPPPNHYCACGVRKEVTDICVGDKKE